MKTVVQNRRRQPIPATAPQSAPPEPATTGVIDESTPEHLAERILTEIRRGACQPHQKILSQRRLASRFGTTPAAVYKAVAHLRKTGYVYTRGGSGVYLTEQVTAPPPSTAAAKPAAAAAGGQSVPILRLDSFVHPHVPLFKTLQVALPINGDPRQVRMWSRAFEGFRREFPFIRLDTDVMANAKTSASGSDVQFAGPIDIRVRPEAFLPLDSNLMAQAGYQPEQLPAELPELGRPAPGAPLLGLPLLRTTTMLAANRSLLREQPSADRDFQTPADLFQAGRELEAQSGGQFQGFILPSCPHGAALYGITVAATPEGGFTFPRDRMTAFLQELRPWSRPEDLFEHPDVMARRFVEKRLAYFFFYWTSYPALSQAVPELEPLPLPLQPGGFVCEGAVVGTVPRDSRHREEALLLLGYLSSEAAQELLVQEDPHWLAVDRRVLDRQRIHSPFARQAIRYDFDLRSYYTQMNPVIHNDYWRLMSMEVMKYLMGLQKLETVLHKMKKLESGKPGSGI